MSKNRKFSTINLRKDLYYELMLLKDQFKRREEVRKIFGENVDIRSVSDLVQLIYEQWKKFVGLELNLEIKIKKIR